MIDYLKFWFARQIADFGTMTALILLCIVIIALWYGFAVFTEWFEERWKR